LTLDDALQSGLPFRHSKVKYSSPRVEQTNDLRPVWQNNLNQKFNELNQKN